MRAVMQDSLVNTLTGMGTSRDPRSHATYAFCRLTDQAIMAAYRSSWMIRKIIDKPAAEMVREWRDWQAEAGDIALIEAEEKRLGLRLKIKQAEELRGLGGGAIVMRIGSENPALPVNPRALRKGAIRSLHVWHKSRLLIGEMVTDPASDWYGQPAYYQMQGASGTQTRIHPSRVIAFRGTSVPDMAVASWEETWWGDSRVQSVMDAVKNSETAENGFASMLKDARNRRIGIPGLFQMVTTAAGQADFSKRMEAFALGESLYGVSLYDAGDGTKGGESIDDRQMVWSGIPELKASFLATVAGAGDMPATVLLGKSPDGMNATGAGDLAVWQKTVQGRQDLELRPCLDQLDTALIASAGVTDPEVWYAFAPLSTPTEAEQATTFKTTMDAVTLLRADAAIPEVALNKAVQNLLSERAWLPGLDGALAELDEAERFGGQPVPGEDDPSAIVVPPIAVNDGKGGEG